MKRSSLQRVLAVALCATAVAPAVASADFGIAPDSLDPSRLALRVDARTAGGMVDTRAAGHPFDAIAAFELNSHLDRNGIQVPDGNLRDIAVDLPAGLTGNPQAASTCSSEQLRTLNPFTGTGCPVDSQVGTVELRLVSGAAPQNYQLPLYNMTPARNEVAAFAFTVLTIPVRLVARVRSDGDYGLTVDVPNLNESLAPLKTSLRFWGVPADPVHDPERGLYVFGPDGMPFTLAPGGLRAGTNPRPFLTLPSDCAHGPFETVVRLRAWQPGSDWLTYAARTETGVTGCERLTFDPSITVRPDSPRAGASTGLTVQLDVPQNESTTGLATPPLRRAVVTLPVGMRVSPASAAGLGACSDSALGVGAAREPACPQSSRIGDVTLTTPLLKDPLPGEIYLGQPLPSELLRLFLVIRGPGGLLLKLPGVVRPDERTGQLVTTFDDNPQLPFSRLVLHFKGGPTAPLSNPPRCGRYLASATLRSWAGTVADSQTALQITEASDGAACRELTFTPGFDAGVTNAVSGTDTSFTLQVTRSDGDEEIGGIDVQLPAGVSARVAELGTLCPDSAAASGSCPPTSRIGDVVTSAGSGPDPLFLRGDAYLTESYRGAPFGMSIAVPAIAGPFDLGMVVVRAAVEVDRKTAALRVVSDPLPTILRGIPLQVRLVDVTVNRPGFMVSPTSCRRTRVAASIGSTLGRVASASVPFQMTDCSTLPFRPRLAMSVGRRGRTRGGISTPIRVALDMPAGNANNRSVAVTLPDTLNALLPVINRSCTRDEFESGRCSKARIGSASAVTPLLRDPLRGDVFLVRGPRRLPDLVVRLHGQVDIELVGRVAVVPKVFQLKTTFDTIPDVPISRFRLSLVAGRHGPVGTVENLCSRRARRRSVATVVFVAHNGTRVDRRVRAAISGCERRKSAR